MNSQNVATIVLKVNGEEAQHTIDNLTNRIKLATEARDKLNASHTNGTVWSAQDLKAYTRLTKEINSGLSLAGYDMQATFRFLQYGLYVDAGTGNGYRRGNGGNLQILDKDYRRSHKMGKGRTRRPWFSRSWYISREVLKNKYAALIGEAFVGAFDLIGTVKK